MIEQRLDKWLWCARVVKTRAAAVHAGDVVTATPLGRLSVLRVIGTADRRGPPSAALNLYEDITPRETPRENEGLGEPMRERGPRPTKRDRRRLDSLRSDTSDV